MTPETVGSTIRTLFQAQGGIDREIEKVIDYYRVADASLSREIQEYEVTDAIARNLRTFLEAYERTVAGAPPVDTGGGTPLGDQQAGIEIGAWVAGFYGSGKSSFTKYLGFALDPTRRIGDRPFVEFLADRIHDAELRQLLRTTAQRHPAAVVNLDLGSDQLVVDASSPVTNVLYQRVLRWAGYSKVQLLADLEYELDRRGQLGAFADAFAAKFGSTWAEMHDDALLGVAQAAHVVPQFLPAEFPDPGAFRATRHAVVNETVHDRALKMIDLVRRRTGRANVIFMVDEAAQYVAARRELMLNLQGLAQSLKAVGQGHAWIVATGQQALTELVDNAALNSGELSRLKDRFPIQLNLEASDIREITWRRLLRKTGAAETDLRRRFGTAGQSLVTHARIQGAREFNESPTQDDFVRFYPFLPTHFSLVLNTVRALSRAGHGALGLRSAIRLVQDILVQRGANGGNALADAPIGTLVTIDRIYDVLRADIQRVHEHVPGAIDHVATHHTDGLSLRVAKAVGALQPLENFPRTAENIAALLYPCIGAPSEVAQVAETLRTLAADPETGLADDPDAGGYTFMSAGIRPLIRRRDDFVPPDEEVEAMRLSILKEIFTDRPSARLLTTRTVNADVVLGERRPVTGSNEAIRFQVEFVSEGAIASRRDTLLAETVAPGGAWATRIAWLCQADASIDDTLRQTVRFNWSASGNAASNDPSVQQFVRTERRMADGSRRDARRSIERALMDGTLIFGGTPTPAATVSASPDPNPAGAASASLRQVADRIFTQYHLANAAADTDLATKFLNLADLSRIGAGLDPLGFAARGAGGVWQVDATHGTLDEARRAFDRLTTRLGRVQLNGSAILDHFADPPYGWSKDVTRYIFAALFRASLIRLHTQSGVVTTVSPVALDAFRTTQTFNRAGFSRRDDAPSIEMLQRAAQRLGVFLSTRVLMDEPTIARVARERIPGMVDQIRDLPARLEALRLAGADRADRTIADADAMLANEGAGAIQQLGGTAAPAIIEDYAWALRLANALTPAARRDITDARDALQAVTVAGITVDPVLRAAITDLDSTEEVADRLVDMRNATRQISDLAARRARQILAEARQAYDATMDQIDAMSNWAAVDPGAQRDIKALVQPISGTNADNADNVANADARSLIASLTDAVAVRMRLASESENALRAAAQAIAAVPQGPIPQPDPNPRLATVPNTPHIVQLGFADLFGSRVTITSSADVEAAVNAIRRRLQREIDAGNAVELGS